MKNPLIVTSLVLAVFFITPTVTFAHSGTDEDTGFDMMRSLEDQALGDELHEEMEDLMVKMMSGIMTEAESERMILLMNEYPGPQAMMMNRMMSMQFARNQAVGQPIGIMGNFNMMPWGMTAASGLWPWLFTLLYVVLLVVGILALIWLWQRITKK
jgi:hypothetical protein